MGLVNEIRAYVFEKYIKPAFDKGEAFVTIRAGDVHKEMGLRNRIPAVCTALGANKAMEYFSERLRKLGHKITVILDSSETPPSGYGASAQYTYTFEHDQEQSNEYFSNEEYEVTEDEARKLMSEYLSIELYKARLNIRGKYKEFDLVNEKHGIVGDFKNLKFKGQASAEMSNIVEYVWLMEKLEHYTKKKWRKIIVGAGNKETFEKFAKKYDPWLNDLEIYFITSNHKILKIR
ncbi:MAG: hypothetical protein DRJ31_05425 [Candidatus Methanomethylicota archaeon]|uniref:Uncharacterized protein n=1 Tax=Thermoproteota archaeon TaxID=2056631 RepID=A0A497EPX3_9CREN|nr:MAG: hypothetical protein DRJ31_05425 [Candidatus Verstraetearchaeota archaeon]